MFIKPGPAVLAFCFLAEVCFAKVSPIHQSVEGGDDLKCMAHLYIQGATPTNLVLEIQGTGIYPNAALLDGIEPFVENGSAAQLNFDKPGIGAELTDDSIFIRHTQNTMVECAMNSLDWALSKAPKIRRIFFRGHSEGALLVTKLYRRLIEEKPELAKKVTGLWLTSAPLAPWKAVLEFQLKPQPKERQKAFWTALEKCDWKFLKEWGETPCNYIKEAISAPSMTDSLNDIAQKSPGARFEFSHGLKDANTDPRILKDFEAKNRAAAEKNAPHINMTCRYYDAGHSLNEASRQDFLRMMRAELAKP